ncbi:ARMC2 protein, partial [Atractosteus spatula]|nr:ARMC2 protein [Atractosteus spatula]
MSSAEKKFQKYEPFYLSPSPRRKTSAEIISEARRSLRTFKTQRPFTPRYEERQLFGPTSCRTSVDRPPSSFSLHARHFETPDSRPGSGKRLSPLEHKPKLPICPDPDLDTSPPLPKPPADPLELNRTSTARARLFKAGSLGMLPPMMQPEELLKRLNSEPSLAKPDTSLAIEEGLSKPLYGDRTLLQIKPSEDEDNETGGLSQVKCEKMVSSRPGSGRTQELCGHMHHLPHHLSTNTLSCHINRIKVKLLPLINAYDVLGPTRFPSGASSRPCSADSRAAGGRTGSNNGPRTTEDESEESFVWKSRIFPVLQELESPSHGNSLEQLCDACDRLHRILDESNLLGRKCRRRAILLKTLFKLIDMGSDQLNLQLTKLILALSVTGNNLLNVCKLIFKISRSENNDSLFQNSSIIDSLLSVLCSENIFSVAEALLYCMGTLKFLSGNSSLLKLLQNKGAVSILLQLTMKLNDANRLDKTNFTISGHILVQLTATLRNLADLPQSRLEFLSNNGFPELCVILEQHSNDKDICMNVARVLSKLSSYTECCAALASCAGCYRLFLILLNKHQRKKDLVVRIVFTLGNLTAKNNEAREQFFTEKGSVDTLLGLFHTYLEMGFTPEDCSKDCRQNNQRRPSEVEDVLIKLIRVLANLSIHPTVGTALASNQECIDLLVKVLEYKSIDECEELVINAAATINNLSYYPSENSVVRAKQLHVAELLLRLLLSNNMEAVLEATRVFGNLSQTKEIRDFILQKHVYKFMTVLLDSKNQDVCFSACGVLINLTADKTSRTILREGGIQKLIDCLRDFGPVDWQLAGLVCKTLWNYSEESAALCFGEEETKSLLQLLSVFLDENIATHWNLSEDYKEFHKACWETEFVPVAQKLMNRIQNQYSVLEPLGTPS